MENTVRKWVITVVDDTSEQGMAKGNLENSSTIVRRNLFFELVGKGPLKSRFNLSNGEVALINLPSFL